MAKEKNVIGIDEAGRGPLAGPLVVGAVLIKLSGRRVLKGIKDSKKLSSDQREKWFKILKDEFECHTASVSAEVIDRIGISKATSLAVKRVLKRFSKKPDLVLLDGLLFAPEIYKQKTITKGDEKEPVIGAASVVAKVTRDKKMVSLHKKFPKYGFDRHKAYGTRLHRNMIKKNGISKIHRKSFCKNI